MLVPFHYMRRAHHRRGSNIAGMTNNPETEAVREHLAYPVENRNGNLKDDKTQKICSKFFKRVTVNMLMKLQRHHHEINSSRAQK